MKPIYPLLTLLILVVLAISCGQSSNTSLGVTFLPNDPTLVPYGKTINTAGSEVEAPFFTVNKVTLSWSGTDSVLIQAIVIKLREAGSSTEQTCSLGGTDLSGLFYGVPGGSPSTTPVVLGAPAAGGTPTTLNSANGIVCGGLTVSNKDATTFNIRGTARVMSNTFNSSGQTTGRATAIEVISVH